MKKIYLSIVCLCFFSNVFAQAGTEAGDPQLLVGATLTVRTLDPKYDQKDGYTGFYKLLRDYRPNTEDKAKTIAFYDKKSIESSLYDSLVNKTFTCVSVKKWPESFGIQSNYYALELQNPNIGTLYYRLDPNGGYYFKRDIKISGKFDFYCSQIEVRGDRFNSALRNFMSPSFRNIHLYKEIKGIHITYTMRLEAYDESPHENHGFMILFSDKTKIVNTTAAETVDVSGGKFEHSVSFNLTPAQILKFKTATITDFRVAGDDVEVPDGDVYRAYMNCLVNMK